MKAIVAPLKTKLGYLKRLADDAVAVVVIAICWAIIHAMVYLCSAAVGTLAVPEQAHEYAALVTAAALFLSTPALVVFYRIPKGHDHVLRYWFTGMLAGMLASALLCLMSLLFRPTAIFGAAFVTLFASTAGLIYLDKSIQAARTK
jgi:hypothetical protein